MGSEGFASPDCLNQLLQLKAGQCIIKDGGFATQLEHHGALINDPLWSALCLITNPQLISKVHDEYLEAGAEIIVTSSYQATLQGFRKRGIDQDSGEELLRKSVWIACEARDRFWSKKTSNADPGSIIYRPLVAASIGSYGAFLADGSEYSGDYGPGMTLSNLKDFHRRRLQVLSGSGPDLLAIETIPSKLEAQAMVELLEEEEHLNTPAWFTFSSKDGRNLVSGDSFSETLSMLNTCERVVAVGINCCPPHLVRDLIVQARKVTFKPIIVYPNSGEEYDPITKLWRHSATGVCSREFVSYVAEWKKAGASVIGGCCRTTPQTFLIILKEKFWINR